MSSQRGSCCLPLVLGVLVVGVLLAEPVQGKKVALLVGVKSYHHPDLPDLRYTERDIEELAELLRPAGYQVTLLTSTAGAKAEKRKPTAANIQHALDQILANVTKHDIILVALAGHGVQPEGSRDSYFCPSDANSTQRSNDQTGKEELVAPETLLSLNAVLEKLTDSGVGVKLLLVDACRNDPKSRGGRGIDSGNVQMLAKGVVALFSCSPGQRSFETAKAGGGHGVFFHFVLEGLRGAAKNDQGQVTWRKLVAYVQERVESQMPEWIGDGARQVPNEVRNLAGRSPVLLALKEGITRPDAIATDPGKTEIVKEAFSNKLGMKLVRIPAGKFLMGSPEKEAERNDDEDQHPVTIGKAFYLGQHPVTREQFATFLAGADTKSEAETDGKGGWGYSKATGKFEGLKPKYSWQETGFSQGEDHPVVNVTWNDAVAFCAWLSKKEGREYRLPTEAEWEYACRAGTTTRYFTGEDPASLNGYANVADQTLKEKIGKTYPDWKYLSFTDRYPFTNPVGSFKPNRFDLHDMTGNVWQWCADWYEVYDMDNASDPLGPKMGELRVLRGGSWGGGPKFCRSACRYFLAPSSRFLNVGFRIVMKERLP